MLLLLLAVAAAEEPVTLAYRSTDTLARTTGTRISGTGRYAWLDPEKWHAYAKDLYGPNNNATIRDMDVIDRALLPPSLQEAPRGCPKSDDEPFKRFNWHAPFTRYRYFRRRTAKDPPPPAFRNDSKVEVSHCGGSKFETTGAFFYAFRGSGLYIDIGRSLAFETHDDASRYLLGRPCAPGKPPDMKLGIFQCDAELNSIIAAAKSQGWDSLQFTRHCDAFCTGPSPEALQRARAQGRDPWTFTSMSDALSGTDPRSQLCGFEVVLTKVAGTEACPAGLEFFRGWGGHERCACDASRLRSQRGRCAACAPVTT